MDQEKLTALLKRKFAIHTAAKRQADEALRDLVEIAEAADLSAEQVNAILGVPLLSDAKPEEEIH